MSPTLGLERTGDSRCFNTRLYQRYPITLDAQFKLQNEDRKERFGFAKTINMSSGGVLLATNDSLPANALIELAIDWPLLLSGVCPLRLIIRGCIVRSDANGVAVRVWHHEFRTAPASSSRSRSDGKNRPALAHA